MTSFNKNAEMENGMFDAAQIKRMIINGKKNAIGDLIIFDYKNYHIIIEKDCSLWNVTIGYKNNTIQMPDDDSVNVFVRGKKIPTYFLNERCGNSIDGKLMRWCGRVIDNIVAIIENAILEYDGEPDENDVMEETDDMYQYASEAAEEIVILADSVDDAYSDIIAEMKHDEPDIEHAMERVDDMYRRLVDIENELKWCLQRCDERTGCDIGWDDFCTADYFETIEIYGDFDCPSYSIAEFINDYNCDAADFMNTLIENIWKSLEGQNGDTFRNAIADLDMPFYIAA